MVYNGLKWAKNMILGNHDHICSFVPPEIVKWAWANMEKDGVGPTPNFLSPLNFWTNKMFINF